MYDGGLANCLENMNRIVPTFEYLVNIIAELGGSRNGAFEKAVAIWGPVQWLWALMLPRQIGPILKKTEGATRFEQTMIDLVERGLDGPEALETPDQQVSIPERSRQRNIANCSRGVRYQ
jgi:hypothetical protein